MKLLMVKFVLQIEYSEKFSQQILRNNKELVLLKDQLAEADTHKNLLQNEMQQMREKWDVSRLESLADYEDTISEIRKKHEREKNILTEDNRKLMVELESASDSRNKLQNERIQMENDFEELRNKRQAIANWEHQIAEIIQWVSDEKDARSYLQALATKMTDELDYLKNSGPLQHTQDKNWRNRRSQKLDKMELLNLQSSLQSEIQAKASISEELSRTRAELVAAQK